MPTFLSSSGSNLIRSYLSAGNVTDVQESQDPDAGANGDISYWRVDDENIHEEIDKKFLDFQTLLAILTHFFWFIYKNIKPTVFFLCVKNAAFQQT